MGTSARRWVIVPTIILGILVGSFCIPETSSEFLPTLPVWVHIHAFTCFGLSLSAIVSSDLPTTFHHHVHGALNIMFHHKRPKFAFSTNGQRIVSLLIVGLLSFEYGKARDVLSCQVPSKT